MEKISEFLEADGSYTYLYDDEQTRKAHINELLTSGYVCTQFHGEGTPASPLMARFKKDD